MKKHNITFTKDDAKRHRKHLFNTTIFIKAITEIIKNICEIVAHWHN